MKLNNITNSSSNNTARTPAPPVTGVWKKLANKFISKKDGQIINDRYCPYPAAGDMWMVAGGDMLKGAQDYYIMFTGNSIQAFRKYQHISFPGDWDGSIACGHKGAGLYSRSDYEGTWKGYWDKPGCFPCSITEKHIIYEIQGKDYMWDYYVSSGILRMVRSKSSMAYNGKQYKITEEYQFAIAPNFIVQGAKKQFWDWVRVK